MESMEIDSSTESVLRTNSIFLHGVDNLSTKDVKAYVKKYVDFDFKIEWINDVSLNVVFESDEDAFSTLKKLTRDEDKEFLPTDEREAQNIENKPEVSLTLRMSNLSDKKVKNAAQYSRYYLYNPPEYGTESRKPRSRSSSGRPSSSGSYREREPVVFKRSHSRDIEAEDDGIDLFPDKAAANVPQRLIRDEDDNPIEIEQHHTPDSLVSRIGDASNDYNDRPTSSGSLLDRIGSKFKEKKLDKDDLFN